MTETAETGTAPPKNGKKPLILGLVFALLGAGGGYFAVGAMPSGDSSSGHPPDEASSGHDAEVEVSTGHEPANAGPVFVALDPLVISLPGTNGRDHLRFAAQLEVVPAYAAEVEAVKPRIVDVLNGYLRAVDIAVLEDPAELLRVRAQMLRRVQVAAGEGRVKDLLIMEFVLS